MCGRYELHTHPAAIALAFGLDAAPDIRPHYNIAPMTEVGIVRIGSDGRRELTRMRWGLVPRWAKDPSIGAKMINARGETIHDKPSFRTAYKHHRCLIPADGFYEWMTSGSGEHARKQPMHVGMKDGSLFAFGGLFERWRSDHDEVLDTCTIVTTEANGLLAAVHSRMPMIVAPENYARWLDSASADVVDLITPFPSDTMAYYPVSTRVNNVRHDDASLIESVPATGEPCDDPNVEPAPAPEQESLF